MDANGTLPPSKRKKFRCIPSNRACVFSLSLDRVFFSSHLPSIFREISSYYLYKFSPLLLSRLTLVSSHGISSAIELIYCYF
ncbi:hypothetical protein SLEP1_g53364 [Rubroshorea leprosula]|uniref:Uncharacterized protein n=1 Tax=Rubroshorea leprosula TaxID=152421 RepID=A0AAV5MD31_9ROSI|nr:hypothetical protein SLEP1_g53364 [Rubroshorea leprosula]